MITAEMLRKADAEWIEWQRVNGVVGLNFKTLESTPERWKMWEKIMVDSLNRQLKDSE